jgi:hypothetical protein
MQLKTEKIALRSCRVCHLSSEMFPNLEAAREQKDNKPTGNITEKKTAINSSGDWTNHNISITSGSYLH